MGRSIPSFALVFAILLGLAGRVGAVISHAHEDGDETHHHGNLHYIGYIDHDHAEGHHHGHDHDGMPENAPSDPVDGDDSEHSHYLASDGPIAHRSGPAAPAALAPDVLAFDSVGLASNVPSQPVPIRAEGRAVPPRHALWPPGSMIERRIGGLGLLL